ncbi:hypothetical protein [Lawsonella clevelandensis]|uniref:hypothetical protein n=1 Tax=Lawsonella clevelandensis TaxID=1528099 RepID=UPI0011DE039A|nr:hypothetical protein [Lawsonella clevelandensis]
MKFSSAMKAVAGAVAVSLIMVTANPVQADPVSSPYTESIKAIAEQSGPYVDAHHLLPTDAARTAQAARADATIAGVTDSGNTLVLGKGHFVKRGDKLAIVGESGNTVVTAPLQALFGDRVMDLNVLLKDGGRSATFLPAETSFRPAPITVMHAREGWIGNDTRLREFYDAWGKYLNRAEVENFPAVIAGGVFGGIAGAATGWAIGFLAGALVVTGMLLFTLVPVVGWVASPFVWLAIIPVFLAVFFAVGTSASAAGTPIGSLLGTMVVGLFSPNASTRELALKAIRAGLALIFLWWLPPSVGDKVSTAAGSGVGSTGSASDNKGGTINTEKGAKDDGSQNENTAAPALSPSLNSAGAVLRVA